MRYSSILQILAVVLSCSFAGAMELDPILPAEEAEQDKKLPVVILKGDDGGTATGEEWNSTELLGRTNLILYVDTGKRQAAMPLINRIDELSYPPGALGVSFVINTSATSIPSFMIRMMVKQREKANSRIRYVLDKKEVLIKVWDFTNEHVNVLILDPAGEVRHRYAGEITDEYVKEVIGILEDGLKNKG